MHAPTRLRRPAFPFRLKLLAYGGALALLPVVFLGHRASTITRDAMKTATRELQLAVAGDVAHALEGELVAAQDGLELVGRTLLDTSTEESVAIDQALRLVASLEAIDHAGVFDAEGGLLDTIREETVMARRLPERLEPSVRREAEMRGVATVGAQTDEGTTRLTLVVPIRVAGSVRAYVVSAVPLRRLQRRVRELAELRLQGRSRTLWVVASDGTLLADGSGDGVTPGARAPRVPLLASLRSHDEVSVRQATGEYTVGGTTYVGTVVGLRGRGLWAVTQVPERVAYADWYAMQRVVLGTALVAALAALVAASILSRRITRPIELLASFAEGLSQRRFEGRVTLATRDELALLGDAMSAAAEDLAASEVRLRQEVEIRHDLGRYLPGELVEKVVRREHDVGLGGRRREITVLFADVVAFTPITEQLEAEKVVALLNELFTLLTEIVFKHGGTVDKFIGDCVMALFGAASSAPDHARCAVAAAEDMIAWLETGNVGFRERYGVTIRLAIGINTGEAVVGNIGSESRMEYTAIGDVVNVAARLESIARPQQILVTETTRALAGEGFEFVDRGVRELPGREQPVTLFEVVA